MRGRAGYAFDQFLVYGTAGAAFGNVRASFTNGAISSVNKTGWTVGTGVEVAFGSKLERQGGIPLRRPRKWIVHHRLRHRQCSGTSRLFLTSRSSLTKASSEGV